MKATERRMLEGLLGLPTAPFHEQYIQTAIETEAHRIGLPVSRDRFGNLYVSYRRGRSRPLALTAHMDHPGFEILAPGRRARAVLLGGVRPETMKDAPVLCFASTAAQSTNHVLPAASVRGRILSAVTKKTPDGGRPRVLLDLDLETPVEKGDFGCFDVPGPEVRQGRLYSLALDNLLSCGLILMTLAALARRRAEADVVGIFTRAEEVGFVGAGAVLRSRKLAVRRPIVVLEMSKEIEGFRMGQGPGLRVGDRMTCFDPSMDLWLASRAGEMARKNRDFVFQRALMTGGACEASLYLLHGRRVGAIALPLGNYHNMTPRGGIGSEFASLRDFEQGLDLLQHLATHPPDPGLLEQRRQVLDSTYERLSPLLRVK